MKETSAKDRLYAALRKLPPKPVDVPLAQPTAANDDDEEGDDDIEESGTTGKVSQAEKKAYSEKMSAELAQAFAAELRSRGLPNPRPANPGGDGGKSGAERRMSGGIGAKKVDVTSATEEAGLVLAISIKTINFKDARSRNYQKNLVNRRGDMLFEAVTLHRRFPYAVCAGFLFFDEEANRDGTSGKTGRKSTFRNAHDAFKLFTHRIDSAGRDEQFERFYIALHTLSATNPKVQFFLAGEPEKELDLDRIFDELVELVALREPDLYVAEGGQLRRRR
ncbi:MAG: hypothetical protein U0324_00865 [Polyangiales bacterium]